jgi:hypothetical protein
VEDLRFTGKRRSNASPFCISKIRDDSLLKSVLDGLAVEARACFVGLGGTAKRCDWYELDQEPSVLTLFHQFHDLH